VLDDQGLEDGPPWVIGREEIVFIGWCVGAPFHVKPSAVFPC
jgi:hypothetical protein